MLKIRMLWILGMAVLLLISCGTEEQPNKANNGVSGETKTMPVSYELVQQLDFIPNEVGTSLSIVQDEKLYFVWADIFKFEAIPAIDFQTEEVLFVTAYADGCDRELESVEKDGDTLIVTLTYPEHIRNQKQIACTEMAVPKTYVVKMEKTNTTKGKLIDIGRTIYEEDAIVQEKL